MEKKNKETGIVIWRSTFNDGFIPVTNFIDHNKEKDEKDLKGYKTFEELNKEPTFSFKINGI